MNLSIRELNELIYCIGIARMHGQLLGTSVADNLEVALRDELDDRLEMELWNNTLLDGLKDEPFILSKDDAEIFFNEIENPKAEANDEILAAIKEFNRTPIHFVSNEEADEDAGYKPKGITQAILNFVQLQGDATYTEMQNFYRKEFGSNSFSHILKSLIIPYKNRTTRRYLSKMANGNYEVKVAQLHNWVEKDY
jgi:hypothetical protein